MSDSLRCFRVRNGSSVGGGVDRVGFIAGHRLVVGDHVDRWKLEQLSRPEKQVNGYLLAAEIVEAVATNAGTSGERSEERARREV